tara:strand:+ start:1106 stop:1225 length:120 start_codon:yes stop_codon:yes gene_type:complete
MKTQTVVGVPGEMNHDHLAFTEWKDIALGQPVRARPGHI